MPHSNATKKALGEALKRQLTVKKLEKITIGDLTADCNVSRMAFYYHFQDIYDLAEWVCVEDGKKALQGKRTYDTWQEGFSQIFEAALESKAVLLNVCRSIDRERMERYLYKLTYGLLEGVVEERCSGAEVAASHKAFIADFYKYGFVGIVLDWIGRGMKEDYHEIVENMGVLLNGSLDRSIQNFERTDGQNR